MSGEGSDDIPALFHLQDMLAMQLSRLFCILFLLTFYFLLVKPCADVIFQAFRSFHHMVIGNPGFDLLFRTQQIHYDR